MEKTWRWFGKNDKITLQMLRQIGVEGIVTALHEVKNGDVWTYEAIMDLKRYIERAGLRWSVVESLPVMESIKYGGPDREELIDKYIESLENLGKAGVRTVCYNFMPVIDWLRTDLEHPWPDGSSSLYFSRTEFAFFDIYILKREGARDDYSPAELAVVDNMNATATPAMRQKLIENIIIKTQGFVNGNISEEDSEPVKKFRALLALYKGIDRDALRNNMKYWLERIMPVCDKWNINMCVHPDDP
ncbi:MAG: mannonate dehydratase, partial [Bacteroidales bacterium]|nr:mannonate dehydratase [Bacteroidales bacterium]